MGKSGDPDRLPVNQPREKVRGFMGVTVRQKKRGKGKPWWVFVCHNGERQSMKIGDRKAADKVASALREKIRKGQLDLSKPEEKPVPTFGEYSKLWADYIGTVRRESTHDRYQELLRNHVLPVFETKRLNEITRGDVRDFLVSKLNAKTMKDKEGYSRATMCVLRDVLSGVFNFAVDEEIISVNPMTGITKRLELNRKDYKPEIHPLTMEELAKFLSVCQTHYSEFYPFFLMAARTGMRLGELLAVQWGDIDFNSSFIWVRRSYRRGRITATKNGKDRKVDMSGQLAATLKRLRVQRKKEALRGGLGEMPELIFHTEARPIEQNYIRRVFKRALKKAELREIRLHDLRHTFASLLLTQKETPVYVKEQLGHSSINITVDIYGHLIPGSNKKAVDKLDDLDASTCTLYAPASQKAV